MLAVLVHDLDQGLGEGRPSDERVLQEIFGRRPPARFLAKAGGDKLPEGCAEAVLLLEGGRRLLGDEEQDAHGVEVGMRGATGGHLQAVGDRGQRIEAKEVPIRGIVGANECEIKYDVCLASMMLIALIPCVSSPRSR